MNQVDGIAWRLQPHEVAGDHHIVRPCFMLDDVERLENLSFRFLDARSGSRSQSDSDQGSIRVRKNLGAHSGEVDVKQPDCDGKIAHNNGPSQAQYNFKITSIERAQVSEQSPAFFNRPGMSNQPG